MNTIRRVFHENLEGESIFLSDEESHHASRVLRLKTGSPVEVFNGKGGLRPARIGESRKNKVEIVFAGNKIENEPSFPQVTLAVAPPKGQRMDTLVQMLQELGIHSLIPISTERSVFAEPGKNRYARWKRVAISAAKQSGSNFLIEFKSTCDFNSIIAEAANWDLSLLFHKSPISKDFRGILDKKTKSEHILACIGPEGGFSKNEAAQALQAGLELACLPTATLRVETASVYALSALIHEFSASTTL